MNFKIIKWKLSSQGRKKDKNSNTHILFDIILLFDLLEALKSYTLLDIHRHIIFSIEQK